MPAIAADLPLVARFPALAGVPRAQLCSLPTPVSRVALADGRTLQVKRDDLSATPFGGNKARGLEWLLGGLRAGGHIVTVGPTGSNHALATATQGRRLGATTTVIRWRQHMNLAALAVDARLRRVARVVDAGSVLAAYPIAWMHRLGGATWIPAGGATPLAILGHVNGALELAEQIRSGAAQHPTRLFVPLGTGGTVAGLALGLRIAGLPVPITAVRVVPRLLGRAARVASLANRTAALLERLTGQFVPRLSPHDLVVEHGYSGGEYGRPLGERERVQDAVSTAGFALDDTYSLKACAAALASSDPRPMLWLTFDGRILQHGHPAEP